MGITSSRALLYKPPEPRKSELYPKPDIRSITEANRLVRDQLREEAQRRLRNERAKACNRLSIVQVTSEGLQQEDVRSLLPMEANPLSRSGYNGGSAKFL